MSHSVLNLTLLLCNVQVKFNFCKVNYFLRHGHLHKNFARRNFFVFVKLKLISRNFQFRIKSKRNSYTVIQFRFKLRGKIFSIKFSRTHFRIKYA
jgi:hypothetical protein